MTVLQHQKERSMASKYSSGTQQIGHDWAELGPLVSIISHLQIRFMTLMDLNNCFVNVLMTPLYWEKCLE